jgi:DNA-binding transcriptional MerR regulator
MANSETSLTAAECAARTGLSVRALRVYEDCGLIHPSRTAGGWRVYGARELIRLNTITLLKSAGLTLAQIGSVTRLSDTNPSLVHVLQMQIDAWKAKQEAANRGQALAEKALRSLHANDSLSIDELCNLVRSLEMSEQDIMVQNNDTAMHEVKVSTVILDRYVGCYRLSEHVVITVTRDGETLYSQQSGNVRHELIAQSDTEFYAPALNSYGRFEADAQNRIAELVIYQRNGIRVVAPRIDSVTAAEVQSNLAARVASQKPTPGSDVVLRRLLDSIRVGEPIYNEMSASFAETVRQQLQLLKAMAKYLGEVTSLEFRGVGNQGYDVYTVRCERGESQWRIELRAGGIIENAMTLNADPAALGLAPGEDSGKETVDAARSESALRRMIESIRLGAPNYEDMTPLMAHTIKLQLPQLQTVSQRFGELIEIQHKGTDVQRFDTYEIKRERGSSHLRISLDDTGRISFVQSVLTGSALTGGP